MSVWMFPGQGAQFKGMGKGLFKRYRVEADLASDILGYSIEDLCLADPHNRLGKTQWTQPAIYTVNALHFRDVLQDAPRPRYLIGHSSGEYNALEAAGMLDFATGLRLTAWRGHLMNQTQEGGMAAVIGIGEAALRDALLQSGIEGVSIANFNAPAQTVLSGAPGSLARALDYLEACTDAVCLPVNVSGAFHSPLMEEARQVFEELLASVVFEEPAIPVIASGSVTAYTAENAATQLARQIVSPVRWTDTIRHLMAMGEDEFREVGPGHTLTRLVSQIAAAT